MTNSSLCYSVLVSAAVGVITAAATVIFTTRWRADQQPAARNVEVTEYDTLPTSREPQSATIIIQSHSEEIAALQRQLEDLRNQQQPATERISPRDGEVAGKALETSFMELEQHYIQDPPDPTWSRSATADLTAGLEELGRELEFSARLTDCRTDICRATLEWSEYAVAQRTASELAHRNYPGLNCAQSIWLKPPKESEAPYTANLYLDCTKQRAGLVEVVSAD